MKVTDHITNAKGKTLFSFEIVPPVKGRNIQELYNNIDPLMEFNPPFIDVTTSREETIYIKKEGLLDKKTTRMRPGTVGICASIQHKYNVDTVPHVICGGFTKEETEYMLVDCHYLGIQNVMALRGDARSEQKYFEPTDGGHPFAINLVKQIQDLNCGKYLHESIESEHCSEFCIGVAGYPEKHLESPSLQSDLKRLKEKVDAGADYVVTVKRHMQLLPQVFRIDMPQDLIEAVDSCATNKDVRAVGIEWAIQQSKELKAAGVPVLHYYSMGKSDNIKAIAEALF